MGKQFTHYAEGTLSSHIEPTQWLLWFQLLVEPLVQAFHQFTTCFFNFPSRYSALSVNGAYLALMMVHPSWIALRYEIAVRQGTIKAAWQAANSPGHRLSTLPRPLPPSPPGLRRQSLLWPGDPAQTGGLFWKAGGWPKTPRAGGAFTWIKNLGWVSKVPSLGYHHLWLAIPSHYLCLSESTGLSQGVTW